MKECFFCKEEFDEDQLNDDEACPECAAQLKAEDAHENKLLGQEIQEELDAFNREAGYE